MRRGRSQSRRARRKGRDIGYLIGNGAGKNKWSWGRSKKGSSGKFRYHKPSWR